MTANRQAQLPLVLHMFDNNDGAISIIEIEFDYLIVKLCYYYSLSCSRIKLFKFMDKAKEKNAIHEKKFNNDRNGIHAWTKEVSPMIYIIYVPTHYIFCCNIAIQILIIIIFHLLMFVKCKWRAWRVYSHSR